MDGLVKVHVHELVVFIKVTAPPSQAARVQLVRASTHSLELSWTSIPNATNYLLEVQKLASSVLPSNATLVHPVSMLTKDEDGKFTIRNIL